MTRLREMRERRGLTQHRLARRIVTIARTENVKVADVSSIEDMLRKRWEKGAKVSERYQRLLCLALECSPAELGFDDESPGAGSLQVVAGLDEAAEIMQRMRRLTASNIDPATLRIAELLLEQIALGYETGTAVTVYASTVQHRRWIEDLLGGRQTLKQRASLLAIAGRLSGLLGYLAFDLGNRPLAHAYCEEAFHIAEDIDDRDLVAWVRGTQSFIAYYSGRYREALDLARDGQQRAGGSLQAIRLAASGEARALGKLGDRPGVDEAVERAVALSSRLEAGDGVGFFLSLNSMGIARVYGNAASAYLALEDGEATRRFTGLALPYFEQVESARASTALTIVDSSMSHLLIANSAEPEEAGRLMRSALKVGSTLQSKIVADRAKTFLDTTSHWSDVPEIASVEAEVRSWRDANAPG